jgi:predicted RNA-binding protein
MCSSTAYFRQDSEEELVLSEVMFLKPQGRGYRLVGLLGDEKIVDNAQLLEIDFERNRIVLGPRQE